MVITSRSGRVALNPTWYQAALRFIVLGIAHNLSGNDHLPFLPCLVIPPRGDARPLGGGHPPGDRRRSPCRAMGGRRVPQSAGGVVRGVIASDLRAPGVG